MIAKTAYPLDSKFQASIDKYNSLYNNWLFTKIEASLWFLTSQERTRIMNLVIDAAHELCGTSYFNGSVIKVASEFSDFSDNPLLTVNTFLMTFKAA